MLKELGVSSVCLNSYLPQINRMRSLKKFKSGKVNILLATDVAARGLDIKLVDVVINFDIPRKAEDYIHRVGRTARGGKRGLAISIIS